MQINVDEKQNILILGVGEGGGRIASQFSSQGFGNVLAINAAKVDLDGLTNLESDRKFLIPITNGQGAAKNPDIIKAHIDEHREEIINFIKSKLTGQDVCFICVSSGGGSGAGIALYAAEIVSDLGLKVGVICTLPQQNEGSLVFYNALKTLKEIHENAKIGAISPLIIVDNNKITKMYESSVAEYWTPANRAIVEVVKNLHQFSQKSSKYMSALDGQDLKRLLSGGGCCAIGEFSIDEIDSEEAIFEKMQNSFFMDGFDLNTSTFAGIIITGSEKTLQTITSSKFIKSILNKANSLMGNSTVFRGVYDDDSVAFLKVYVIFNGLKLPSDYIDTMMSNVKNSYEKIKTKSNRVSDGVFMGDDDGIAGMFGDTGGNVRIVRNQVNLEQPNQSNNTIQQPKNTPIHIPGVKRKER